MNIKVRRVKLKDGETRYMSDIITMKNYNYNGIYHNRIRNFLGYKDVYKLCTDTMSGEECKFFIKPINYYNKVKLLWLYKKYWIQKEKNILWTAGVVLGILTIIFSL